MSSPLERHRRLRAVLDEAIVIDEAVRAAYLDAVCAGDPELRSHVVRLLALDLSRVARTP